MARSPTIVVTRRFEPDYESMLNSLAILARAQNVPPDKSEARPQRQQPNGKMEHGNAHN